MAYPIHPSEGYLRTPARYPHDAFGVDTGGRVRPHSGFDATPTVTNCPARSVLGGTVVQTGYTIYAGHYVVENAPDGWLWLSLHMSAVHVSKGQKTSPDSIIGVVGNTGGGGGSPLKGNAAMGKHIHVSRCRDMAAVNRIINGRVRARLKNETSAQWAEAHGLSDPYPHILNSVKTDGKTDASKEEDDMTEDESKTLDAVKSDTANIQTAVGNIASRMWTANRDLVLLRAKVEGLDKAIAEQSSDADPDVIASAVVEALGKDAAKIVADRLIARIDAK